MTAKNTPVQKTFPENTSGYTGKVISFPERKGDHIRFQLEIEKIVRKKTLSPFNGIALVYLKGRTSAPSYGDRLLIKGSPYLLSPPKNPGQFDYKGYLLNKGIAYQHFSDEKPVILSRNANPVVSAAGALRNKIQEILNDNFTVQKASLLSALITGNKSSIDENTKISFSRSGIMHILAVSGLHVGIIYLFLSFIFSPLKNTRTGRICIFILVSAALWFYVILTGFSPSVQRATIMFTILAAGKLMTKKPRMFNNLFLAAFVILLADPFQIFQAGFLFSFSAVAGILLFHSLIYNSWTPGNIWIDKLWNLLSVSLSAQLTVLPLTIFFFRQVPVYFLLGNLLAVPLAFLLLGGTLIFLPLSTTILGDVLSLLISFLLEVLFWFTSFISELPVSVLSFHQPEPVQVLFMYLLILLGYLFFRHKKLGYLQGLTAVIFILVLYPLFMQEKRDRIICYHIPGGSAIGFISGERKLVYTPDNTPINKVEFALPTREARYKIIKPAMAHNDFRTRNIYPGFDLIVWKGKKVGLLSSMPDPRIKIPELDLLIVRKIKFNSDIRKQFMSSAFVADGTCFVGPENKHDIYSTYYNGAYILNF